MAKLTGPQYKQLNDASKSFKGEPKFGVPVSTPEPSKGMKKRLLQGLKTDDPMHAEWLKNQQTKYDEWKDVVPPGHPDSPAQHPAQGLAPETPTSPVTKTTKYEYDRPSGWSDDTFKAWQDGVKAHPPALSAQAKNAGFNIAAYHGTGKRSAHFEEFENPKSQIGVHFGTKMAAHDIMGSLKNEWREGSRIYTAALKAHKPLRMHDLGSWYPDGIAEELKRLGFPKAEVNKAMQEGENAAGLAKADTVQGGSSKYYSEKNKIQSEALRKLIEAKGYDSIIYKNAAEDVGSDSYIIWKLNNIRSQYAKFDPNKAHLNHLAASLAAGGIPAGLAAYLTGTDKAEASPWDFRVLKGALKDPKVLGKSGVRLEPIELGARKNEHAFNIILPDGKPGGQILAQTGTPKDPGQVYIKGINTEGGPQSIGPEGMRDIQQQLQAVFPDATSIGGGINVNGTSSTLTVTNSTLAGNVSLGTRGGAISSAGAGSTLTVTNSTLTNNRGGSGGGIRPVHL